MRGIMRKARLIMLVTVSCLIAGPACADDGGWWEWLQSMSGPTLMGFGSNIHLVCLDEKGNSVNPCENWWFRKRPVRFDDIKHEIDFRFGVFWNVDNRVVGPGAVRALKLMTMYHYHVTPKVNIGAGIGFIPFFGGPEVYSRGVVTPISFGLFPFDEGGLWAKSFFVQIEENYLANNISGALLGNPASTFSSGGEWRFTVLAGFDFRRGFQR